MKLIVDCKLDCLWWDEYNINNNKYNEIDENFELVSDDYMADGVNKILIAENFDTDKYQFPIINYPHEKMTHDEKMEFKRQRNIRLGINEEPKEDLPIIEDMDNLSFDEFYNKYYNKIFKKEREEYWKKYEEEIKNRKLIKDTRDLPKYKGNSESSYYLTNKSHELEDYEIVVIDDFDENIHQFPIIKYPSNCITDKDKIEYLASKLHIFDLKIDIPNNLYPTEENIEYMNLMIRKYSYKYCKIKHLEKIETKKKRIKNKGKG